MRILKRIFKIVLIVIAIIIVVPLVTALFVSNEFFAEKEIVINKPVNEVFNYVKKLGNQDEFSVWQLLATKANKKFTGTDGTVGFIYAWKSDIPEVGTGEQEIKKIDENNRMDYEVRYKKPWESIAQSYFATESISENQTKVIWNYSGNMNYPTNFFLLFWNNDGIIGNDLEKGLANLKKILEQSNG